MQFFYVFTSKTIRPSALTGRNGRLSNSALTGRNGRLSNSALTGRNGRLSNSSCYTLIKASTARQRHN